MAILKAVSMKVDPDTIAIVSFMYHTEVDPLDPVGKRKDRSKSQYRFEGRKVKIADLQAEITQMKAAPDAPWAWPNLTGWTAAYDSEAKNSRGAKWLADRIKKAKDLDTGFKILNGWKASSNDYKNSRKYELQGYKLPDGTSFDLTPEALEALPCTTFSKVCTPKKA